MRHRALPMPPGPGFPRCCQLNRWQHWVRFVLGGFVARLGLMALAGVLLMVGCRPPHPSPVTNTVPAVPSRTGSLKSPNGHLSLTVNARPVPSFTLRLDDEVVLRGPRLGLSLKGGIELGDDVNLVGAELREVRQTWENPWGKRRQVTDHCNELRVVFQERRPEAVGFEVIFRAYDDGVAFRYVLPSQPALSEFVIEREKTEFAFGADYSCFAGQQEKGFRGAQEWEFKPGLLGAITTNAMVGLPLLVQTPLAWVAVAESDLRDWAGMWLCGATPPTNGPAGGTALGVRLAPRLDQPGAVVGDTPMSSPWRVLMVGREPGQLIESDLIANLATPNQLQNTAWIKPGKMAWDHWWSGDVKMDTETIKEYIQLAADMGWPYQLIDWQWYGPFNTPQADITKVNPAVDMAEVRRFAKEKHVRLWLWLYFADANRNQAYEDAFALYEDWGIAGVKIDFMDRDDQAMVEWYAQITRAAAEHHLMVNFHGAFKPAGFNRTYPNQITREGILGNEYNRWSSLVTPEHKLTLPFTRFLEGPADFTPGGFQNRQPGQFKADGKSAQVQGTRASELALFVLYDSPLCCVCDSPERYRNQPGADFLKLVPTVWDDTQVLEGEPARYLTMVRRVGEQRFLGAMTVAPRGLVLKLDFLPAGRWNLRLWKDAADSTQNAEHIDVVDRVVTPGDTLVVPLASAGGCVGWFRPETDRP